MTEDLGFEIREPTQDYPFTVIIRNRGDGNPSNWTNLDGRTLGELPDLSRWGLELAIQERVEGPERVVSSTIYVPELPREREAAEDYPGRVPGTVLSKHVWETFKTPDGDIEIRVVPGVDHDRVAWATPLSPEQQTWIRMKEKIDRVRLVHPELEMLGRAPIIRDVGGALYRWLEAQYKIHICRECAHFDEEEGKKEYEKITHQFENGFGQMNKDIAAMVSAERKIRGLDETKIGLCLERDALIETTFQACPEFEGVKNG